MTLQRRIKSISFVMVTLILISGTSVLAHEDANDHPKVSFKTEKVSGSVYMLSGVGGFTGGNIGLSVGNDGVAMIDNGLSGVLGILRKEVAKTTDQPIDYLINTHVHGDHIGNNEAFGKEQARVISHENLRKSLVSKGVQMGDGVSVPASKEALPVLTFSDQMTLHLNGDAAHIKHFSSAHTDGDAIVHFKEANVIHTGDIMFNTLFPFIDTKNGGSFKGMLAALKGIHSMANEDTKIIPGHGPLASKADVAATIDMLQGAEKAVQALINDGLSDDEIVKANPLSAYEKYSWNFITAERMTKQVIEALR